MHEFGLQGVHDWSECGLPRVHFGQIAAPPPAAGRSTLLAAHPGAVQQRRDLITTLNRDRVPAAGRAPNSTSDRRRPGTDSPSDAASLLGPHPQQTQQTTSPPNDPLGAGRRDDRRKSVGGHKVAPTRLQALSLDLGFEAERVDDFRASPQPQARRESGVGPRCYPMKYSTSNLLSPRLRNRRINAEGDDPMALVGE
jgi:hypothetical protein